MNNNNNSDSYIALENPQEIVKKEKILINQFIKKWQTRVINQEPNKYSHHCTRSDFGINGQVSQQSASVIYQISSCINTIKMRFYIVAIVIVGTASAAMCDDEKIFAEDILKDCAQQIGISPETLDIICAGDWTDHNTEAKVKYIKDNWQPHQTKRFFIFYIL